MQPGIIAVIELQALAGIKETKEGALKVWESFSEEDKKQTMSMHKLMCVCMNEE